MNKALFWDFDGTLVYSEHLWSGSLLKALERHYPDNKITLADIRPLMARGFTWDTPDNDYSAMTGELWWEFINRHILGVYKALGLSHNDAEAIAGYVRGIIKETDNYHVYSDTFDTLLKCRQNGWKNYILSNNYPELREVTDKLGFSGYFDGYIISGEIGYDKPRREIYDYALKISGNPDNCFMIGDNFYADIIGAENAGIKAILVHKKDRTKYQADNLADIFDIMTKA
jgi:putative hydrolase of the HAD superfamily